jgi:hypothetical protein
MDSNTYSTGPPAGRVGWGPLVAVVDELAAQDLDGLSEVVAAERVAVLWWLVDRLAASGARSWPGSTPAGRLGPSWTSGRGRPRRGCASGWGWVRGRLVVDAEGADAQAERRHGRRGLWLAATLEGMVAVGGLLEAEAGGIVMAALEPLARPADAHDDRSGGLMP